jgi:DNA-binding CsgD family transcriptional regulator
MLLDRRSERDVLDQVLQGARDGRSRALVVRGGPGVGKTALLEYAIQSASDLRVVHAVGAESEMELAFAALHQLCIPMLDRLERLPSPQRDALGTAFGLAAGDAPDRFLVGLATLSLLSEFAEDRPLLCIVDDAQWLDSASMLTLAFVARRLLAESVAIVFAVREPPRRQGLEGLPDLPLEGLGKQDARALLAAAVPGPLDDRVRDRIVAETRGNPLALLELPRGKSAPQLAGGFDVPAAADLPGQLERHYLERIRALPDKSQRLLLLAAAEPLGDAALLMRAAESVGVGASALAPAQDDALLEIDTAVRFRHSLVRSAAYRAASPEDRRAVHEALAGVTDPDGDADRRAWHRALAAAEPDEEVAAELEQSAGRAQMRGGLAAAAAFLELATKLTPDPRRRAQRALAAAQARQLSGSPDMALTLLSQAEAGPLNDLERAQAHLVRGWAAFGSSRGRDAPLLLLAAARELESLDPGLARDTYLEALSAAMFVGRLADDVGIVEVARAARAVRVDTGRPQELLLDGLSVAVTDGYADGAPLLRKAVIAFRAADMPVAEASRWLWLATHAAHDVWDDEGWEALCDRHVALARQAGALSVLPLALSARIGLHLFAGELATAASLVEELTTVTNATGSGIPPYGALALAAYRGHEAEAIGLIRAARAEATARGDGMGLTLIEHSEAVLYNGLSRHPEACVAAKRGAANPQELAFSLWSLPQLVEAASRSGQPTLADDAMERLAQTTSASGTDWALGVEARSRALVSDDGDAEPCYRDAIDHLGRTRIASELARAHLLYGEWLRRQARRTDAREQLRTAHQLFGDMGMEAFAARARRELANLGENVRKRRDDTRAELTPQELQIAHLARDGLSNPEIGARLFLSPRTVEYHLRKVFGKLAISSRHELSNALPSERRANQVA